MENLKHDFLFKQGWLSIKKGLITQRKFCTLTLPCSIDQIQLVYEATFVKIEFEPIKSKSISFLGYIAHSSIKGKPLMIIQSEQFSQDPIFLTFEPFKLREEEQMHRPCCFEIVQRDGSLSCSAYTSFDYQDWISAFLLANDLAEVNSHKNPYTFSF